MIRGKRGPCTHGTDWITTRKVIGFCSLCVIYAFDSRLEFLHGGLTLPRRWTSSTPSSQSRKENRELKDDNNQKSNSRFVLSIRVFWRLTHFEVKQNNRTRTWFVVACKALEIIFHRKNKKKKKRKIFVNKKKQSRKRWQSWTISSLYNTEISFQLTDSYL